jgi:multiple sugar transport system permease protein
VRSADAAFAVRSRVGFKADALLGVLLVLPILVTMVALVFYPLLVTMWDSVHRVKPTVPGTPFIGLENYRNGVTDGATVTAWINTAIYVVVAVLAETIFGIAAALLLNRIKRGRRWLLAIVVLPWALPGVVNSVMWLWIFNPPSGLLNGALSSLGFEFDNHLWFVDRVSSLAAVSVVHIWRMMPLTVVIILAALQAIPQELYDAARMDGARPAYTLYFVTLPLIRSAIAIAMTQSTVQAFNLFEEAWVLNGRSQDTLPILGRIYLETFQNLNFSYGMALSLLVTFLSLLVSLSFVLRIYRDTRLD